MKISVITPVNDPVAYAMNVAGTLKADQLIPVHDAESAAKALNCGIEQAENDICVLCHQDVRFPHNWVDDLKVLKDLEFGAAGVWGINEQGFCAGHVIEPRGHWKSGVLPSKAVTLDELLLIIRKSSGLRFDESLSGWHLYGADICFEAFERGLTNYIIDACVRHLSTGNIDNAFTKCKLELTEKWQKRGKRGDFRTPNTTIYL